MPSIKDVAKRANVSTATVSYVLNNTGQVGAETRERVLQAVQELGYQASSSARSLRAQRSHLIGYSWHPTPPDQPSPILDSFLHSLGQAAADHGYHILAVPIQNEADELASYERLIRSQRVDGVVLGSTSFDDARISYLREQQFPFVAFGRANPEWDFAWVDVDGAAGTRLAVEHLVGLGHRRIGYLGWAGGSVAGDWRRRGYEEGLRAAGITPRPEWQFAGQQAYEDGYRAAQELLAQGASERPTALVCVSDVLAIGVLNAALDRGVRIPEELAITGFDNVPLSQYLRPGLTTLEQPIQEVGQVIMTDLLRIINGERLSDTERHRLLVPSLVVRGSTVGTTTP
jgi:DNA-binding LacI/PurR family transcriptional regulator